MKPALILFVCTGNICRSPMAVALFQMHATRRGESELYRVESAGTWGVDGEPASLHAQAVIHERGGSLDGHVARTVTRELLQDADLILVMTRSHRDALAAEFPQVRGKVHLVSELNEMEYDISDPYGKSLEAYEMCASDLEQLIARGYPLVSRWLDKNAQRAAKG